MYRKGYIYGLKRPARSDLVADERPEGHDLWELPVWKHHERTELMVTEKLGELPGSPAINEVHELSAETAPSQMQGGSETRQPPVI